jgi:cyclin-dependent kinase regulatory subunit CKS1
MSYKNIYYSDKYYDDKYEYRWVVTNLLSARYRSIHCKCTCFLNSSLCRLTFVNVFWSQVITCNTFYLIYFLFDRHVQLPKDLAKLVPKSHLMTEAEWRGLGVQQSQGWIHYMIHQPGIINAFIYFMKLFVTSFFLQSLTFCCFDAPSPHPQWKKRNHKIGLPTCPPEIHQVRLSVLLLIIISIWRFLFNSLFSPHLPIPVLCSTFPTHSLHSYRCLFFFCIFLGFQKSLFLSLVSVLIEPENLYNMSCVP